MAHNPVDTAVLFADLADSTRLYESLGDAYAFTAVREVITLLRGLTEGFGGRVVKTIGDGMMCVFPSAESAARAAGEMQTQVEQWPPLSTGKQLAIRVGFRFGPVIPDGDDVFGDSVNVAARLAGLALPGQVLTDAPTVALLDVVLQSSTRPINALPVKGKAEEIEVYEFLWQSSNDRTIIPGRIAAPIHKRIDVPRIRITYQGRQRVFEDTVFFGREAAGNHVLVLSPLTSRRHAKIELRAGKFVLIDQSSNGTYVVIGGANEIHLKREEVLLYAGGRFAFGASTTEAGVDVIEFDC